MKAGTTTLYRDLSLHPDIFLPEEKEPEVLLNPATQDDLRTEYADLFAQAPAHATKGEASTGYTKRPDHEGVAASALALCGQNLKLIHLRRDPIARTISHYKHDFSHKIVDADFETAVRTHPRYLDYSRYDWQLAPWRAAFGANLLELRFEDYVADRVAVTRQVCVHLGLDPDALPDLQLERSFNAAQNRRTPGTGLLRKLVHSRLYQRRIKPRISKNMRDTFAGVMLKKAPKAEVTLSPELEQELRKRLEDTMPE